MLEGSWMLAPAPTPLLRVKVVDDGLMDGLLSFVTVFTPTVWSKQDECLRTLLSIFIVPVKKVRPMRKTTDYHFGA